MERAKKASALWQLADSLESSAVVDILKRWEPRSPAPARPNQQVHTCQGSPPGHSLTVDQSGTTRARACFKGARWPWAVHGLGHLLLLPVEPVFEQLN